MPGQEKPPIKPNLAYCCSVNLLPLKLLEIGCTLATLILAAEYEGNGYIICIEIVAALALVTAASWAVLYCLNMNARFPEFFSLLMAFYHLTMTLLMIAATGCAAFLWPQFKPSVYSGYMVATITSAVAAVCFLVDTIFSVMWWRGSGSEYSVYPCSPWEAEIVI